MNAPTLSKLWGTRWHPHHDSMMHFLVHKNENRNLPHGFNRVDYFQRTSSALVSLKGVPCTARAIASSYDQYVMEERSSEVDSGIIPKEKTSENRRTLYLAIGSTLVFSLYSMLILDVVGQCFRLEDSPNSLGLTFSYTLQMVQEFFELRSQDQLGCYREFLQIWDVIFAVIYASMYCFWIMYFFHDQRILLAVPLLAMVADWAENFMEIVMINSYLESNSISETLVSLGSGINMLKLILLTLTYLVIFVGIGKKIKSFLSKSKQN